MDQVKSILTQIFRLRFWILCPIIILATFGAWYVASGDLKAEAQTNRSQWDSAFTQADGIRSRGVETSGGSTIHPNEVTYEKTTELISQLTDEIKSAWQEQYREQEELLVWPSQLSEEFREAVDKMRPIETSLPYPTNRADELERDIRAEYRDFIKGHLPRLAEIVGALWWQAVDNDSPTSSGDECDWSEQDYIVEWDETDQTRLQNKLAVFPGQEEQDNRPTTLQLLYAQEDLWVVESLLRIIERTNGDAERYFQAVVRRIESLELGRDLSSSRSAIRRAATGQATGTLSGGASFEDIDPADGRYVDKNYEPLSGDQVRSSYDSTDPEQAYLSVAKRMPVRMKLFMDQRRINKLLVECANSPLTFEVRQLRINSEAAESGGAPTRQSGLFGGGSFGGRSTTSGSSSSERKSEFVFGVPVEVYGVVYIYNPQSFGDDGCCDGGCACDDCTCDDCTCDASAGEECSGDGCSCDECGCGCDACN